jgi:hypothetical protein
MLEHGNELLAEGDCNPRNTSTACNSEFTVGKELKITLIGVTVKCFSRSTAVCYIMLLMAVLGKVFRPFDELGLLPP